MWTFEKQEPDFELARQGQFHQYKDNLLNFKKGEKIRKRIVEIEEQLAEHKKDTDIESVTAILDGLKIVEKRPSAAFFKQKEVIDGENKEPKKEKFHAHRTKLYNEKAKENQPIKTVRKFYFTNFS